MSGGYFDIPFATSGDKATVPEAIQPSGSISYTQGWGPDYAQDPTVDPATALLISRSQTNQLFFDITTAIQYLQQHGAAPYITTSMNDGTPYAYNKGAVCSYNAGSGLQNWISRVAANGSIPGADNNWVPLLGNSSLFVGNVSTGSANAQVVTSGQGTFTNTLGNIISWVAGFSNTSTSTLNVDGIGAKPIKVAASAGLRDSQQGDIISGGEYLGISDGTNIQLINPTFPSGLSPLVRASRSGLGASWQSNTTIAVAATQLAVQNSSGFSKNLSGVNVTINAATSGAGGLDTGSFAANTWYYSFIIWNPTTNDVKGLLSASAASPTLPAGYTYFVRVGSARADGSTHFIPFLQNDVRTQYTSGYQTMASGAPAYPTAIAVGAYVPNTAAVIHSLLELAGNSQNGSVFMGSSTSATQVQFGAGNDVNGNCRLPASMMLEGSNIYYGVGGPSGANVYCIGYEDNL